MSYQGGGGWRALGRGIKDLGHGVGRRRLEDEERARRDRLDKEAREQAILNRDIMLAERGGGEGPVPTRERDLTSPPPPQTGGFDPGSLFGEPDRTPAGADDFMPAPEFDTSPPSLMVEEDDPRYRAVGDGQFHIMDPEAQHRERQESDFNTGLEQGRRRRDAFAEDMGGTMARASQTRPGELGERDMGLLGAEGMEPPWLTPPGRAYDPEADPVLGRARVFMDEGYGPMGGQPPQAGAAGGGPREASTRQQMAAQEMLSELRGIAVQSAMDGAVAEIADQLRDDIIANSPFSPEEARHIMRTGTMPDGTPVATDTELPEPGLEPEPSGAFFPDLSFGGAGAEPPAAGGPPQAGPVRQEITQDQADYLREVQGMTDEQVRAQYIVR